MAKHLSYSCSETDILRRTRSVHALWGSNPLSSRMASQDPSKDGAAAPETPADQVRQQEGGAAAAGGAAVDLDEVFGEQEDELAGLTVQQIRERTQQLEDQMRGMTHQKRRLTGQLRQLDAEIKDNESKLKLSKQLPWLVSNVVEVIDPEPDEDDEEAAANGATAGADDQLAGKGMVVKTTTRQTVFLPVPGLVDIKDLRPGDLVGVNKDSYLILDKLPTEYDARVKAMELDEKPTEDWSAVGGLDKQIQELVEAIVLPMTQADKFKRVGVEPPKGVLMHGPPGTGKTLLARACAAQTDAVFLKLTGPSLVQMYIGDGAKMIRDAFDLAKEKGKDRGGAIIFIDEIDAIGGKRFDSEQGGDREVQRTMLELLNQLDGFEANSTVKVIAATNRPDILDPALMRSGRLDRKVELPHPNERARAVILEIHSRKMTVDFDNVNFDELARSTEDFNGAMLKAVCTEAGMLALRRDAEMVEHEDFVEGIQAVQMKKKQSLQYYA